MPSSNVGHDDTFREDRVLAVAALTTVVVATAVMPQHLVSRSLQALALAVPASLAATIAWQREDRRLFAPPVALLLAAAVSGVLAVLRGQEWTFGVGAAAFILGGWLPWPRWRTSWATVVLWALATAPLVLFVVAAIAGWSDWPVQLVGGGRISSAPGEANLNAWSLLWSVLGLGVLADRKHRGARPLQAVSLGLLGAAGGRAAGLVAGGVLLALLWRDHGEGVRRVARRHAVWGLFLLLWLPRVLGRLQGAIGSDAVAGVSLSRRSVVWATYWEEGRRFLSTGGGIGLPQQIAARRPELAGLSTHNEYFWLALSVGIVGVVLVVAAWYLALRARRCWVLPAHPEMLAPAVLLPVVALVDDPLLALTFVQPYLVLLAAVGGRRSREDPHPSAPSRVVASEPGDEILGAPR